MVVSSNWDGQKTVAVAKPSLKTKVAPKDMTSQKENSLQTTLFQGLCKPYGVYSLKLCISQIYLIHTNELEVQ